MIAEPHGLGLWAMAFLLNYCSWARCYLTKSLMVSMVFIKINGITDHIRDIAASGWVVFIILAVIINATYPDTCLNYDSFSLFEIIFACQIFHVVVMTFRAIYTSFLFL